MVQVYLGLDQPFTALQLLQGADDSFPDDEALTAEPFWRLGMFEENQTYDEYSIASVYFDVGLFHRSPTMTAGESASDIV
jgi:hypothetical protein